MEFVQGCAICAASIAAISDLTSRRIPNWLTLGTFGLGLLINAWTHGTWGVAAAFAGAAIGLAVLLPFWTLRAIGAGDVKLLAALGAVLGPALLMPVLLYGAIAGGVLSLVILLGRGHRQLAFAYLNQALFQHKMPTPTGATAPYGVAIAAGVYLSLVLPSVLA